MGTFTKVNGQIIKQMDMDSIPILREQDMRVIGKMINNMEKV